MDRGSIGVDTFDLERSEGTGGERRGVFHLPFLFPLFLVWRLSAAHLLSVFTPPPREWYSARMQPLHLAVSVVMAASFSQAPLGLLSCFNISKRLFKKNVFPSPGAVSKAPSSSDFVPFRLRGSNWRNVAVPRRPLREVRELDTFHLIFKKNKRGYICLDWQGGKT